MTRSTKWLVAGILLVTLRTSALPAQEPRTEAGARAAAVALLHTWARQPDTIPIVTDTVAVRKALVRCTDGTSGESACTMLDGKQVKLVLVRLTGETTAAVEVQYYQVLRGTCPLGQPYTTPILGFTRSEWLTLGYANGRWKQVGSGRGMEC